MMNKNRKQYVAPLLELTESTLQGMIALSECDEAADPGKDWEAKGRGRYATDEDWDPMLDAPPADAWKTSLW